MKKAVHTLMGFEMDDNHEFLVIGAWCWGLGKTIEQAMKNASVNGDVKRCYCKIVPIEKKTGGRWEICNITGGITVFDSKTWKHKENKVFNQTWNKAFHVGGNKRGRVVKYGFDLFTEGGK